MPYVASVDKDLCMSSGACVAEAPAAFRFDADELAEATHEQPPLADDVLLSVARDCPAGAISLVDERGQPVDLG